MKQDLPQSTLDLIAERNRFDIELYDCAAKIFQAAINRTEMKIGPALRELESARLKDRVSAGLFSIRAATRKAINRVYSAL
jgi:hypothetical protein